jgi:site-specific DNA recombinase
MRNRNPVPARRRAVAYVRVSTDQQVDSGLSIASQRERLQAWATMQGDVDLVDIVVDAGESARDLNRPGAERVLSMIEDRTVDVVVIAKLDRLTRSMRDLDNLLDLVERQGVALVSLGEHLDTATAAGRMLVRILGVVAQWERETIGERTRDALRVKRSRGERFTNIAPTGFRFVDGRRVVDERESRMIETLRAMGHGDNGSDSMSLRDKSRALAAAGFMSRTGKPLTAAQVARLVDRINVERDAA